MFVPDLAAPLRKSSVCYLQKLSKNGGDMKLILKRGGVMTLVLDNVICRNKKNILSKNGGQGNMKLILKRGGLMTLALVLVFADIIKILSKNDGQV